MLNLTGVMLEEEYTMGKIVDNTVNQNIKKVAKSLNLYVKSKDFSYFMDLEHCLKDFFDAFTVEFWKYNDKDETLSTLNSQFSNTLNLSTSITQQVIKTKSVIIENHATSNKYYNVGIDNPSEYKIKSLLVLPIIKNKIVIGVLRIYRGIKQRKNFIKKDEITLLSFMPLLVNIVELKSIAKEELLILLNENITPKVTPRNSVPLTKTLNESSSNEIIVLQKQIEELKRINISKEKAYAKEIERYKDRCESDKVTLLHLEKELEKSTLSYKDLEQSSIEIYDEFQDYKNRIKKLENHISLLAKENKTLQKELKKKFTKKQSIAKLKSEHSFSPKASVFDINQNLEFILQRTYSKFLDNEHSYILFELMLYALSSKNGMAIIEEGIVKTKLTQLLIDRYYFKGDMEIHHQKFRISDMSKQIKGYKKTLFSKLVALNVNISEDMPTSLVFDAAKVQSVILHLMLELCKYIDYNKPLDVHFIFKKKFLSIELGGFIDNAGTFFHSMFTQIKLTGDKKHCFHLDLSRKIITSLKGNIEDTHDNKYYRFTVTIPIQMIKM